MSSVESFIYCSVPMGFPESNVLFLSFFFSLSLAPGPLFPIFFRFDADALDACTGDGHEEQPFVTDKKENDLSGYERNLYLYHVSVLHVFQFCRLVSLSLLSFSGLFT